MTNDEFWRIIQTSREPIQFSQYGNLRRVLMRLETEELRSFANHLSARFRESMRNDLWAVAYIINNGCSDDCFVEVQYWIIAQGREFFERAMDNPEELANHDQEQGICSLELFMTVTGVLEARTGSRNSGPDGPEICTTSSGRDRKPDIAGWDETTLPSQFPELWRRYWY